MKKSTWKYIIIIIIIIIIITIIIIIKIIIITHEAKPNGLLTHGPSGRRV